MEFPLGGDRATIGAMAKGAGMIAPNMATLLAFFTTDAAVDPRLLHRALREAVGAQPQPHHRGRRHLHQRHGGGPGQRRRAARRPSWSEGRDYDAFRAALTRGGARASRT